MSKKKPQGLKFLVPYTYDPDSFDAQKLYTEASKKINKEYDMTGWELKHISVPNWEWCDIHKVFEQSNLANLVWERGRMSDTQYPLPTITLPVYGGIEILSPETLERIIKS